MAKYTSDLKLEIVNKYMEGTYGLKALAKQYHVTYGDVKKWVDAYKIHGSKGLCTTHGTYTGDFKINVIEYMHTHNASYRQTAAHFNIPSFSSIINWEKIYLAQGPEALYIEKRGGNRNMSSSKTSTKATSRKRLTEEELLEENKRLRMENEYLKKLNALIQERENSQFPTK